jgi:hypothetical protein
LAGFWGIRVEKRFLGGRTMSARMQLLTTVSAIALAASATVRPASAGVITLEVDGSWLQYSKNNTDFLDPGITSNPGENPFGIGPHSGNEFSGKASFQPDGSPLIFSGVIQFGRTDSHHASADGVLATSYNNGKYTTYAAHATHHETHTLLEFEIGQDFGLGMFGHTGSSVLSGGVRYANFSGSTNITLQTASKYGTNTGTGHISRRFSGFGPVVSWDASLPFGDMADGGFAFDWGASASILFGQQKVSDHVVTASGGYGARRNHSKTVPAAEVYAGFSYHFPQGEYVGFGYKLDTASNVFNGAGPSFEGFGPSSNVSRTSYGPYVKLGISFGN